MVASWEILANPTILVGVLHTDNVTMAWSLGLRNLHLNGVVLPVAGMPYCMARNTVCQRGLEMGVDYVGFLDSDVIPPRDCFQRLMRHRLPIVSGIYHRRSPPHGIPVMIKGGSWVTSYPPNSLIEVDFVGAGLLVIHRSLLEQYAYQPGRKGKRWFDWTVDAKGTGEVPEDECLSEDFTFCRRLAKYYGVKTMVDTSVIAKHVGFAEFSYGNVQPLNTDPNT
jgi:hypothetical protein